MPREVLDETAINVTAFKAQCLALIDAVAEGKASRVVLTRHGRPSRRSCPVTARCPTFGVRSGAA